MVEIRMQVPDNLTQRLQPMHDWLPTVLELSLIGFKTPAVQTASEIIEFLAKGPSPNEVVMTLACSTDFKRGVKWVRSRNGNTRLLSPLNPSVRAPRPGPRHGCGLRPPVL